MYALNTFFRITRFVANSFVGLVVGFFLGYAIGSLGMEVFISKFV